MGEHLGDGVDVHSLVEEYGGVGVAEAVEGDMLGDACGFEPFLELLCDYVIAQAGEYIAGGGRCAADMVCVF